MKDLLQAIHELMNALADIHTGVPQSVYSQYCRVEKLLANIKKGEDA